MAQTYVNMICGARSIQPAVEFRVMLRVSIPHSPTAEPSMPPLLKRILVNGAITAAILGGLGYLYAEMTAIWMSSNAPARVVPVDGAKPTTTNTDSSLRVRLPLALAAWGFGFILVAELALFAWRGHPKPPQSPAPKDKKPDAAEQLLEQLLAEADEANQKRIESTHEPKT